MKKLPLTKEQQIWIGLGILTIVLIAIGIAQGPAKDATNTNEDVTIETPTSTPTTTAPVKANTNKPTTKPSTTGVTYEAKVKQYGDRRFQINDACQVFPAQSTFANNTAVMFDNRSAIDRVISLSGKEFTVKAKGWIEMKLTSKTLPNTINVSCGSAYNVAKIILQ